MEYYDQEGCWKLLSWQFSSHVYNYAS